MKFSWRQTWARTLVTWGLLVAAGLIAGALAGEPWAGLALSLLGLLIYIAFNLNRLGGWVTGSHKEPLAGSHGIWADLSHVIDKRGRKFQKRRKALHRVIREFRDASNAMPDGLISLDEKGQILWFNESAKHLLGFSRPDDYGRAVTNLIRQPNFHRWLSEEETTEPLNIQLAADQNRTLIFRSLNPSSDKRMLVVRDVTVVRQLDQMRRDFVANVSHELRTPLTVIAGYLEAMQTDGPDEWKRAVDQMANQARRMNNLVEDLLVMARLEAGKQERNTEAVDIPSLVAGLAEEAQLHSKEHEVATEIDGHQGVNGIYKDLRIAFGNLITNALNYSGAHTVVTITWNQQGDGSYRFSVQDNGPGIPSRHIPRLTERFYRVDSDRSRASGGSGLGLAIVKHILSQHGAQLEIESEVGVGSRFSCVFPAATLASPRNTQQHIA